MMTLFFHEIPVTENLKRSKKNNEILRNHQSKGHAHNSLHMHPEKLLHSSPTQCFNIHITTTIFNFGWRPKKCKVVMSILIQNNTTQLVEPTKVSTSFKITILKEHAAISSIAPDLKRNIAWQHRSSRARVAPRHPCWWAPEPLQKKPFSQRKALHSSGPTSLNYL